MQIKTGDKVTVHDANGHEVKGTVWHIEGDLITVHAPGFSGTYPADQVEAREN